MKAKKLLGETGIYQLYQAFHGSLLVGTVGDDADGGAAHDAQAQNAQQALGVNAALFLLNPDGRLVLVGLLNEEGSRTGMQADFVLNGNFFNKHDSFAPISKIRWASDCYNSPFLPDCTVHLCNFVSFPNPQNAGNVSLCKSTT